MKFQIPNNILLASLQPVAAVVTDKAMQPVLANVLLRAEAFDAPSEGNPALHFQGANPQCAVSESAFATVFAPGAVCVPAAKLMAAAKALPDGAVDGHVTDAGWLTLKVGKARFSIASTPADEYPEMAEPSAGFLPVPGLLDGLAATAYAAASPKESHRYQLGCVRISFVAGRMIMAATDTVRLASWARDAPGLEGLPPLLVDIETVRWVRRHMAIPGHPPAVAVGPDGNSVWFRDRSLTIKARLLSGRFPDLGLAIPMSHPNSVVFKREDALAALRGVSAMSDKGGSVRLTFGAERVELAASGADGTGEASDAFAVETAIAEASAATTMRFAVKYLVDALDALPGEKVLLRFGDAESAVSLRPYEATGRGEFTAVLMPEVGPVAPGCAA